MTGIYTRELHLRSEDVDLYRRLRLSRLFSYLQEASIRHTEELGMGREKTLDRGLLWILTMQQAEILRMPEYDEHVLLKSWPGKTMHLFFPRYYSMETADGEPLLKGSALWCLISSESRRFVFPEQYGIEIEGIVTGEEIAMPSAPKRLDCAQVSEFRVPFSYVDLNGHMNNTRYFDLAEDSIPAPAAGRRLRRVQAEYVNEAHLGDTVRVSAGERDGRYFVTGEAEKCIFRMSLEY